MKVLHVVEPLATGIMSSIALICRELRDRHEFHVLHGARPEMPDDYRRRFPVDTGFRAWNVGREINLGRDLTAIAELRRTIRELKPDIVHAHASKAGALARVTAFRGQVPVIYSPRGYSFLRQDVSGAARFGYRAAEWCLGRARHLTVACGTGEYREAARVASKATLIHNMIDLQKLQDIPNAPSAAGVFTVVMCGGIRPQKNFPLFCRVAERFLELPEFRFVWIGGGEIPAAVTVPANVSVTGWVPHEDSLRAIAGADVFMQTSGWEGLPISVLEAMALGKPVLARPGVGNTELVTEGVNGFLCRDAEDFAVRLTEMHADPAFVAGAGARSLDHVRQFNDSVRVREAWHDLYEHYRGSPAAAR